MKAFSLVAAIACTLTLAGTAAAVPGSWYWTPAHATAAAKTTATVPYCRLFQCVDGQPSINGKLLPGQQATPAHLVTASCTGTGASVGGRYRQFLCKFGLVNDIAIGQLMVYTAGPAVFRWHTVCVRC